MRLGCLAIRCLTLARTDFKTGGRRSASSAGSIPVRLRYQAERHVDHVARGSGLRYGRLEQRLVGTMGNIRSRLAFHEPCDCRGSYWPVSDATPADERESPVDRRGIASEWARFGRKDRAQPILATFSRRGARCIIRPRGRNVNGDGDSPLGGRKCWSREAWNCSMIHSRKNFSAPRFRLWRTRGWTERHELYQSGFIGPDNSS
jgi:hypothetical protein